MRDESKNTVGTTETTEQPNEVTKQDKKAKRLAKARKYILKHLRVKPNFPDAEILFCDVCGVLSQLHGPRAIYTTVLALVEQFEFDAVMVPESRGFLIGMLIAALLDKPIILARKKGKLPFLTFKASQKIEYGDSEVTLYVQELDFVPIKKKCAKENRKPRILLADDLIAIGGTQKMLRELVMAAGCEVAGIMTLFRLKDIQMPEVLKPYQSAFGFEFTKADLLAIESKTKVKIEKFRENGWLKLEEVG